MWPTHTKCNKLFFSLLLLMSLTSHTSAIHEALRSRTPDIARDLIVKTMNNFNYQSLRAQHDDNKSTLLKNPLNELDCAGMAPIHLATQFNFPEIVSTIISYNADINLASSSSQFLGDTAAVIAIKKRNEAILEMLLLTGAKIDTDSFFNYLSEAPLGLTNQRGLSKDKGFCHKMSLAFDIEHCRELLPLAYPFFMTDEEFFDELIKLLLEKKTYPWQVREAISTLVSRQFPNGSLSLATLKKLHELLSIVKEFENRDSQPKSENLNARVWIALAIKREKYKQNLATLNTIFSDAQAKILTRSTRTLSIKEEHQSFKPEHKILPKNIDEITKQPSTNLFSTNDSSTYSQVRVDLTELRTTFENINVDALVVALTERDQALFHSIYPKQLRVWLRQNDRAQEITRLARYFKDTTKFFAFLIVSQPSEELRYTMASKLLKIAMKFYDINNFWGLTQVMSAFAKPDVHRLLELYNNAGFWKNHDKLLDLLDARGNHKNLVDHMLTIKEGNIMPLITNFFTALEHIDKAKPEHCSVDYLAILGSFAKEFDDAQTKCAYQFSSEQKTKDYQSAMKLMTSLVAIPEEVITEYALCAIPLPKNKRVASPSLTVKDWSCEDVFISLEVFNDTSMIKTLLDAGVWDGKKLLSFMEDLKKNPLDKVFGQIEMMLLLHDCRL